MNALQTEQNWLRSSFKDWVGWFKVLMVRLKVDIRFVKMARASCMACSKGSKFYVAKML